MSQIHCPQLNRHIKLDPTQPLMDTLLQHGIPVASSCKGDGICGKCKIFVKSAFPLPPQSDLETKTLAKNDGQPGERLSCQLRCNQEVTLKTTYW